MAIDSTMFGASLPAQAYAVGDVISMGVIRGPAVVRDGYGEARLKRLFTTLTSTAATGTVKGHVVLKNSNWVDSIANLVTVPSNVSLADSNSGIQVCHDCILQKNSGWECAFIVDEAVTTTTANDVIALIDVDYPSVQAVQNPRAAQGEPATIMRADSVTISAPGNIAAAAWTTYNIDILKAGYKYLLAEMSTYLTGTSISFLSISGAAGQNGLERIIPSVSGNIGNMRYFLDYSTPLVKGPMNLNYLVLGTAGTGTAVTEMDWVKR